MKLSTVLLILGLIVAVVSCKSSFPSIKKHKAAMMQSKPKRDSTINTPAPIPDHDGDGVADTASYEYENVGVGSGAMVRTGHITLRSYSVRDDEGVDHTVKDATKPDPAKGIMAYNIPDDMTVGRHYEIKVRITKDAAGKQQLVVGEEGDMPIASVGEKSTITIESIRVESVMSAELTSSDKAFEITTSSTKEQNIEQLGYTEWAWDIKPVKSGEHPIKLVIKVRIVNEQGGFYKDIVVFDRNIKAKANLSYSLSVWFGSYWQWLCTTFIIPIFLWWRKRKKERDTKEEQS